MMRVEMSNTVKWIIVIHDSEVLRASRIVSVGIRR